ncbi:hypothetical protein M1B74_01420 [Bacteroides pyogenes]|uniref:hypothetical protein n=1 Tax=Bacteroides pyogenes TaxID=310300 RepID=UPI003B4314FD
MSTLLIPTIYPYNNDIKETLKINGTISQKRSLEGRLEMEKVAIDIYKKQPICGIGLNNFSQAANRQLYENDNVPFTSFSGSIIYQSVAEQGAIGSVLIILLFLSVLHSLFCNIKKEVACILLLCFVMIMTKELTFPSVFSSSSHLLLLFVLLALKENIFTNKWIIKLPRKNILMLLLVLTSGTIAFFLIRHKKNEEYNQSFIVEMNKGNINKAINQIEKANNDTPYLINKGLAYWYLYKYKSERAALKKSESFFLRALQKNTEDPCLLYNIASIYYADGQIERSKEIMDLLIKNYPHKSLFWLTAFWYSLDNSTVNIDYLINAIKLNPNILESSYFQLITNIDSSIYKDIKTVLTYQENELDPIQSAKYGKLLFLLGDTLNAKCQLEYSLSRLPNLSEPYLSLSIIEEAQGKHILSGLYLKKYELLSKYTKNKEKDILLKQSYNAKFGLWYGSRTFSDGIIHPFD